jgi:hypothetical protein
MHIEQLPARAGWQWVLKGFALVRRQPLPILSLTFLYLMMLTAPSIIPSIGGLLPLLLTPLLAVGLMTAMLAVEQGRAALPRLLIQAFYTDGGKAWKPLLILGGLNLTMTLGTILIASIADNGTLMRMMTGHLERDDPGLGEVDLLVAAALFLTLYTPVQMALWFSPLFVAWHRVPPIKAMFFSLIAVWRNRAPFMVYSISWLAIAVVLSMAIQLIIRLFDPSPLLLSIFLSPLSLTMLAALYASSWVSYRETVQTDTVAVDPIDRSPKDLA